jgi:hypothetical protein
MGTDGGTIRAPLPLAIRYLLGCSQLPGPPDLDPRLVRAFAHHVRICS